MRRDSNPHVTALETVASLSSHSYIALVPDEGFEPPKPEGGRFTACYVSPTTSFRRVWGGEYREVQLAS